MDIIKIVGIGIIAVVIMAIMKQYKPEFAIYISLIVSAIIIFLVLDKLNAIIVLFNSLASKASINKEFLGLIIKITGIAILVEYAVSICKDTGETAIANKVDFGGKIIIISMSIPIISTLLESILKILP